MNFTFPATTAEPVPFSISVDAEFIEQVKLKAKLYRPSFDLQDDSNKDWNEGPPSDAMKGLAKYWADDYDWFKVQDKINSSFSHYAIKLAQVAEYEHPIPLHFVHQRSEQEGAIPLLLLHGWPSTHLEWSHVIGPLTSSDNSTGKPFHIVAPDMPGFGFSPAPTHSGLGPRQMALVFDDLMRRLGYSKYGVVSTDLGWEVGMWMTSLVGGSIIGHSTDFFVVSPSPDDMARVNENKATPQEMAYMMALKEWSANHTGYSTAHRLSPLAIGQALSDTPVGFAGWIWHLLHGVSDGYDYSFEEVITSAMMLFIQGTWGNLRTYKEFMKPGMMDFPRTEIPTAVSEWGDVDGPFEKIKPFALAPKHWLKRVVNLEHFVVNERGGHFPAEHQPSLWVEVVRTFFNKSSVLARL